MKRLLMSLVLVLVVTALVVTASCGPGEGGAKTYKLGFLGPLTGPAAPWVVSMHLGIEMAIGDINEAGGIVVGGETYMLELAAADDKYAPEESVTAVQKLIYDEKVDFIYGPGGSACGSAVRPITEENGVVIFVITSANEAFPIGPEYPYGFAYIDPIEIRRDAGYQWLAENHPEVKTVAFIGQHGPGAEEAQQRSIESAEAVGIEVVAAELTEEGTMDFAPYLPRVLAEDPDLIDCSGTMHIGLVVKQARQMGYDGLFMSAPYPTAEIFRLTAEEHGEGFIGVGTPFCEKGTPEQRAFYERFVDEHGLEIWGQGGMWGYDWVHWMVQAFQDADSFDPDAVVSALEGSQFDGLQKMWFGGAQEWGIAHHRIVSPIVVAVFQSGNFEPIAYVEVTED